MIKENFLQYVWQFGLFDHRHLSTTTGEAVQVLHAGQPNTDTGPDFFNARVRIGETTWAGNVEVHVRSSDWQHHRHQHDKGYQNIILHVVYEDDSPVQDDKGQLIPTLVLKGRVFPHVYHHYITLMHSKSWIPCEKHIANIESIYIKSWMERLVIERLERKSSAILTSLAINKNNWEESFYRFLARYFGMKVNTDVFELLAQSLPLTILAKHKHHLFQLEALLFGQAGLLEKNFRDAYPTALKKEYHFLRKKYRLTPLQPHLWKFMRLRPSNFPTVRIAQLAALISCSSALFSKLLACKTTREVENLFKINVSDYWIRHYRFEYPAPRKVPGLGKNAIHTLIINVVIPFLFIYGKQKDDRAIQQRALHFLEKIPSEKNSIISRWRQLGVRVTSAYDTQALLQLKNEYCNLKKCLQCAIGNKILNSPL